MPQINVKDGTTPASKIVAGNIAVESKAGYEFILFGDRIALLLGGKDFFSAKRDDIQTLLARGEDTRIEIQDYRHGRGYPPFNQNLDGNSLSIAEHIFDDANGSVIRQWATSLFL